MKSLELASDPHLNVLYELPFGSFIYGTNKLDSDLDLICIVKESTGNFVLRYHNKTTNIDNTYVGLNEFISGLANCSNVEFFEALHTKQGKKFLSDHNLNLDDYYNSRQAKAYLGYAARDLEYSERLHHVLRCMYMSHLIQINSRLNLKTFQNDLEQYKEQFNSFTKEELSTIIKKLRRNLV